MKKKKEVIEFRFYEVPSNEHVLALLGDPWRREYGHSVTNLHFHNLMEIGWCIEGHGNMVFDKTYIPYEPKDFSIIPANYPHITISNDDEIIGYWEYLFFDPEKIICELFPGDSNYQKKMLDKLNSRPFFLKNRDNEELGRIILQIMEEMRHKKPFYSNKVQGLLIALVTELLRLENSEGLEDVERYEVKPSMQRITAALDYVQREYATNIKVKELADVSSMSETHFRRVFAAEVHMSPTDYVNFVRIQKACELMKKSHYSMEIVAHKVGFSNTSSFNRNFQKYLGTSPYQWKINPKNYESKLLDFNISPLKGW